MNGISVIVWAREPKAALQRIISCLTEGYQQTEEPYELQVVLVSPEAGARNMGHAYNMALDRAVYQTRVFMHDDVYIHDRTFIQKVDEMLSDAHIGVIGIIGSDVETGAAFFHAETRCHRGRKLVMWWPERARVQQIDGLLMATRLPLRFSEEYEGPHMATEDFVMQAREAGYEIWTVDSLVDHLSGGTIDDAYWRSAQTYRAKWAHMFPSDCPPLSMYRDESAPLETIASEFRLDVV